MRAVARLLLAALLVPLALAGALAATATSASATDYYRYWAFYQVDAGKYVASSKGVGAVAPADGAIEAFRYAAPKDYKNPNVPRIDLTKVTFAKVCATTKAKAGEKRVAVLADFGVSADAEGQSIPDAFAKCAQVPQQATALQVLEKVAQPRTQSSSTGPLLCAIAGYPAKGCANEKTTTATPADSGTVTVSLPTATSHRDHQAAKTSGSSHTGLYVVIIVVVLLAGGGIAVSRRQRR